MLIEIFTESFKGQFTQGALEWKDFYPGHCQEVADTQQVPSSCLTFTAVQWKPDSTQNLLGDILSGAYSAGMGAADKNQNIWNNWVDFDRI